MKRLVAAVVVGAALLVRAEFAYAATSPLPAGVQIQWTSAATATMALVTQYSAAFAQGTATPTLLPSAAGVCTGTGAETAFTLTFGGMTPQKAAPSGCLYKNAVAVSVQTNDGNGYAINEYLDAAPQPGVGICAFPNGGASFPLAPATTVTASARAGNPAAGTFTGNNLTACAAGGTIIPAGTGGVASAGTLPGDPGTPGLQFYSPSGTQLPLITSATPTLNGASIVTMFGGQDIQVNLAPGAPSSTLAQTGIFLTIQFVPN